MGEVKMTDAKKRKSASEVYASVASPDGLLYHVAHARKENSDNPYDGSQMKEISARRRKQDIERFRDAAEKFKERSIPRK
jgi:hypothetical protein